MSWSVGATGPSDELAATIDAQFEGMKDYPCPEPEETVKQAARAFIAVALNANIPPVQRTVSAWGSQSADGGTEGAPDRVSNTLLIEIS